MRLDSRLPAPLHGLRPPKEQGNKPSIVVYLASKRDEPSKCKQTKRKDAAPNEGHSPPASANVNPFVTITVPSRNSPPSLWHPDRRVSLAKGSRPPGLTQVGGSVFPVPKHRAMGRASDVVGVVELAVSGRGSAVLNCPYSALLPASAQKGRFCLFRSTRAQQGWLC